MASIEKLDILGADVSELSNDVDSLLDMGAITLNRLNCLVSKEQCEFFKSAMFSINDLMLG